MQIILLANVKNIGKKDEVKNIPDGYAQNFIIPKKLGIPATKELIAKMELAKKQKIDEKSMHDQVLYDQLLQLTDVELTLTRKVNSSGALFASITEDDIRSEIKQAHQVLIPVECIVLAQHLKHTGKFDIPLMSKDKKVRIMIHLHIQGQ